MARKSQWIHIKDFSQKMASIDLPVENQQIARISNGIVHPDKVMSAGGFIETDLGDDIVSMKGDLKYIYTLHRNNQMKTIEQTTLNVINTTTFNDSNLNSITFGSSFIKYKGHTIWLDDYGAQNKKLAYHYHGNSNVFSGKIVYLAWADNNNQDDKPPIPHPIIHSQDQKLYCAIGGNAIERLTIGGSSLNPTYTWETMLTLPYGKITAIAEYGGYLVIAILEDEAGTNIYFWDRSSTQLSDIKVRLGNTIVYKLFVIDGQLFAITTDFRPFGATSVNNYFRILKIYGSTQMMPSTVVKDINAYNAGVAIIGRHPHQIVDNEAIFSAQLGSMFDTYVERHGLMTLDGQGRLSILQDFVPTNVSGSGTDGNRPHAFFKIGDTLFWAKNSILYKTKHYPPVTYDNYIKVTTNKIGRDTPFVRKRLKRIIVTTDAKRGTQDIIIKIWTNNTVQNQDLRPNESQNWIRITPVGAQIPEGETYYEIVRDLVNNKNLPDFNELMVTVMLKGLDNDTYSSVTSITGIHIEYELIDENYIS